MSARRRAGAAGAGEGGSDAGLALRTAEQHDDRPSGRFSFPGYLPPSRATIAPRGAFYAVAR